MIACSERVARLGDLTTLISSGSTPKGGSEIYVREGPVMLIRSQNVRMNELTLDDVAYVTHEIDAGMNRSRVRNGDVLLNITGASIGRVAAFELDGVRANVNQHVCIIRPRPDALFTRYVTHLISSREFQAEIDRLQHGGTRQALTFGQIAEFKIPLPPLAEQRWIAEVLDRAEALRAKRRAALAQLESLAQSLFLDLFGDPVSNPKDWPKRHLEELCSIEAPLVDPTSDEFRNLLHYGPDRIERDAGGLLPAKTVEEDGQISAKFLFGENAILYSKIRPNLNKVALATSRGLCSADVYPVEVKRNVLSREFLWCLLRGQHFLSYTAEFSNRANIPKINRDQFLGYPAICPPIELQREFARRVSVVEKLKMSQRASLAELDTLFTALQHRAFRGEL